jgi:hypothetical protein
MAKKRQINTKFWDDQYISELDPIEKLLFLYLLTNPLTEMCGIYEIQVRRIALDTGIDKDMIPKIFTRFSDAGKIFYINNNWVYVRNFQKHQAVNDSIKLGIKRTLEEIPAEIMQVVCTLDTEWGQGDASLSTACRILKLKPELKLKPKEILATDVAKNEIVAPAGGMFTGYKLPKGSGKNVKQWQDEAANAIKQLDTTEEKISSVFKCFKDNQNLARFALNDCKELGKNETLYFLKVYNELVKNNKK